MLGGNDGLVSSTMPQEADRGCAEMCYPRPSGTSTTKKQGIKINLGQRGRATAETGNIPLRERQQVRHGGRPLDCYFFLVVCFYDIVLFRWWYVQVL